MSTLKAFALSLACAAVAWPALASHTTVEKVQIAVIDPRTQRELAVLDPQDSFELPENEERQLRVFEPPRTGLNQRRYLAAELGFGPQQTALEMVRRSVADGSAVVRLRPQGGSTMRSGRLHVGYRIDDDVALADENLRLGRVMVEIVPATNRRADEIVAVLYRGILLREPDPAAAARRDDIARNGYQAVLRQAREIAGSRESEIDLYAKGVCNQQRLLALYKQFLGREPAQIDQRVWRGQLEHLEKGEVAEIVGELVESREFVERFALSRSSRRLGG